MTYTSIEISLKDKENSFRVTQYSDQPELIRVFIFGTLSKKRKLIHIRQKHPKLLTVTGAIRACKKAK